MPTRKLPIHSLEVLQDSSAILTHQCREDVVENVEGAQKELLKYWSRVSSNRWLLAKMFGVLVSHLRSRMSCMRFQTNAVRLCR